MLEMYLMAGALVKKKMQNHLVSREKLCTEKEEQCSVGWVKEESQKSVQTFLFMKTILSFFPSNVRHERTASV